MRKLPILPVLLILTWMPPAWSAPQGDQKQKDSPDPNESSSQDHQAQQGDSDQQTPDQAQPDQTMIVITNVDVDDRAKLFALSTGQPLTQEVLDRLRPQIRGQLVDERLRMQEVQRRHIVIQDEKQIASAIASIESRNGMPAGGLDLDALAPRRLAHPALVSARCSRLRFCPLSLASCRGIGAGCRCFPWKAS